jgi:hypothetical protein
MKTLSLALLASASLGLSGCLSPTSSANNGNQTPVEVERPAVESDCQTVGIDALETLVTDVMSVPSNAMLYGNQRLDQFFASQEGALGGRGASETRSCSLLYFKATAHLGMLSCTWVAQNNPDLLFPNGLSDLSTLYSSLTGLELSATDSAELGDLAASIGSFDPVVFPNLQAKRMAAVCSAVFGSLATQTL